eukprot:1575080-Rhodomonas_salina.1
MLLRASVRAHSKLGCEGEEKGGSIDGGRRALAGTSGTGRRPWSRCPLPASPPPLLLLARSLLLAA